MRTRVGYTGSDKLDPTYHDLGGHSEALQIDFDPQVVSYADLLDVFWDAHTPWSPRRTSQYKAAVFHHDDGQQLLALESAARVERDSGRGVQTEILPASRFYRAEDYHQKYRLARHSEWFRALTAVYPDPVDFTDSTAAARLNGLASGYGNPERLREALRPLSGF